MLADEFIRNFARGNSEGLLVALCLWALERHLDGRRRDAFLLGAAPGCCGPRCGRSGACTGSGSRRRVARTRAAVARRSRSSSAPALLVLALWFVPEYIGSGSALRAAERARQPNPDSAAFADFPFLEVFHRSASILSLPGLRRRGGRGAVRGGAGRRGAGWCQRWRWSRPR